LDHFGIVNAHIGIHFGSVTKTKSIDFVFKIIKRSVKGV